MGTPISRLALWCCQCKEKTANREIHPGEGAGWRGVGVPRKEVPRRRGRRGWFCGLCGTATEVLVARGASKRVDVRAGARTVVPHLKRRVEVEDVRRDDAAAGAVNREHR